ncbi:hypothetical protein [Marinifilum sp. D714]|uniref:hypothetical protein n=1 Tax=Marinifilum sp. D714 TaxID=2937523 RepID=UPI0027C47FF6|nr:hypothetical protein [Marinifilum sp. D714]MDQ2178221.1 hypothetical protein [Marinifilum sp. D714]
MLSTGKILKIHMSKRSRWLELAKSIGKNALDERDTQFFTDKMLSTSKKQKFPLAISSRWLELTKSIGKNALDGWSWQNPSAKVNYSLA